MSKTKRRIRRLSKRMVGWSSGWPWEPSTHSAYRVTRWRVSRSLSGRMIIYWIPVEDKASNPILSKKKNVRSKVLRKKIRRWFLVTNLQTSLKAFEEKIRIGSPVNLVKILHRSLKALEDKTRIGSLVNLVEIITTASQKTTATPQTSTSQKLISTSSKTKSRPCNV